MKKLIITKQNGKFYASTETGKTIAAAKDLRNLLFEIMSLSLETKFVESEKKE